MPHKPLSVPVLQLEHGADLPLPDYASEQASGMDLLAALANPPLELRPGERTRIPTGLALALPSGYEAQIRPRSGLAARNGITVLNSPGTIDADYRGEIQVLLIHLGEERIIFHRGDRIAQLIVAPVARVQWERRRDLGAPPRGAAGFGSTGIRGTFQ